MAQPGTGGAFAPGNQGLPSVSRVATTTNYTNIINFAQTANTPFLPETLDKKVKRFGNRSISGFLSKMAAEYALQSDIIRWTEDNRLHLKATGVRRIAGTGTTATATDFGLTFAANHGFRIGQTLILVKTEGTNAGAEVKARISTITGTGGVTVTVQPYAASLQGLGASITEDITAIIYGSEFEKGTAGMAGSLETTYVDRSNNPIILKDKYSVSGSDVAQIGWIEVSDVNGDGGHGYLWYLQSEMDQRARFMDYIETSMIEAVPSVGTTTGTAGGAGFSGSRGLFYELETYGNTFTGGFSDFSGANGTGTTDSPAARLESFDNILKQLDTQGNIEENSLYLNRDQSLAFDNLLGNQSDYNNTGGGPSWGSFMNQKDMALNLGFSGVRRGEYDFY